MRSEMAEDHKRQMELMRNEMILMIKMNRPSVDISNTDTNSEVKSNVSSTLETKDKIVFKKNPRVCW